MYNRLAVYGAHIVAVLAQQIMYMTFSDCGVSHHCSSVALHLSNWLIGAKARLGIFRLRRGVWTISRCREKNKAEKITQLYTTLLG